uniref:Huluwa n=1 Tax=Myripristis murdjan TaxID=586833 RepID=A0A667ZUI9_9TELE
MSQVRLTTPPPNLNEGYSLTSLTLLVLLLIPCVVTLLLLNCLFLGYKLLIASKRNAKTREDAEEMLLQSTHHRVTRLSDLPFASDGRRPYVSLSEPILPHPVTSSRASSKDRAAVDQRIRFLRPDGATGIGSGSLRAPTDWCRSAPVSPLSSDSETANVVPPNSPTANEPLSKVSVAEHHFDKMDLECEYAHVPPETTCLNTSTVGPGLDSDFGASAGVSLRILSADSDGLSNGVLASALEWDYYDPCYVRQNNVPKHKHLRPAIHTKQYWV